MQFGNLTETNVIRIKIYRNAEIRNKGCSLKGETRNIMRREN